MEPEFDGPFWGGFCWVRDWRPDIYVKAIFAVSIWVLAHLPGVEDLLRANASELGGIVRSSAISGLVLVGWWQRHWLSPAASASWWECIGNASVAASFLVMLNPTNNPLVAEVQVVFRGGVGYGLSHVEHHCELSVSLLRNDGTQRAGIRPPVKQDYLVYEERSRLRGQFRHSEDGSGPVSACGSAHAGFRQHDIHVRPNVYFL